MTEQLKPCPFCGGEAKGEWSDNGEGFANHYIECSSMCNVDPSLSDNNKLEAIRQWNNRPYENKLKADAVREALSEITGCYDWEWELISATDLQKLLTEHADKLERGEL